MVQWGAHPPESLPRFVPVRHVIEERALFTPDAPALIDARGRVLSIHEINARANRLAEDLRARGAGPACPVALAGPADAATVIGWLAIAKTRAPVVPLGESAPGGRPAAPAPARILVAAAATTREGDLAAGSAETVRVEVAGPVPATPNPDERTAPDQAALLLPAAGRCDAVLERELSELTRWKSRAFHPGGSVRVCTLSPAATLPWLRDVATTLAVGGALHFPEAGFAPGEALWRMLREAGTTRLYAPDESLDALTSLAAPFAHPLDRLRDIVVVGRLRLSAELVHLLARHPHCRLHLLHQDERSTAVAGCTLDLPFADGPSHHLPVRPRATAETVLHRAGGFVARLALPGMPAPALQHAGILCGV